MTAALDHDLYRISFTGDSDETWCYQHKGSLTSHPIAAPVFEIDGQSVAARLNNIQEVGALRHLPNGCRESIYQAEFAHDPGLRLQIILRTAPGNPVVRFSYRLLSATERHLTKAGGRDNLRYTRVGYHPKDQVTEIVLSEFHEMTHAYRPDERKITSSAFSAGLTVPGPILVGSNDAESFLLAYEHGSTVPNMYLEFRLAADASRDALWADLAAVKGNYYHQQLLTPDHPFETVWMQFAAVPGGLESLATIYRSFILDHLSLYPATRQPLIFYNTWNYQERNKHWNNQPYLASMNEARILAEIEIAHQMGIDVFVLDTGWYARTGDWEVDRTRFPNGFTSIRKRLEGHGMRLGLWFNPLAAAVSSRLHQEYRACTIRRNGKESDPHPVWETEPSRSFCLVSSYAEAFADQLIRLHQELGVTYFKWDAVGQENGCTSPDHGHGSKGNASQERADCYEFELVRSLVRIAEKVTQACPDAICDLDLTESGRAFGLAFLSAGKFFLINNGPYYANYDLPVPGTNENLFFYPGPARAALCRQALAYDRWLPSTLFLTHYFPDETPQPEPHWSLPHGRADSLEVNLASLILGQNGIWGDLLSLSAQGVQRVSYFLAAYKRVALAITRAAPIRYGQVGSSPEIHEKLDRGQGVVVVFSPRRGEYAYITHNPTGSHFWRSDGVQIHQDASGHATMNFIFENPGAKTVFFE
jgi:alpha-galactosidase